MKTRIYKIFSGILIAIYLFSMAIPIAVFATPEQTGQEQTPAAKHEPKRGTNPETGKVSFIGGGDPIFVPGVSDVKGMPPQERAMGVANAYGKEFGLKSPAQELKLLKSEKDANGKDIVRYQQINKGVPVIGGEMIVNMNTDGELLSISGEVASDLTLDTKPGIKAQEARKTALAEMAKLYNLNEADLDSTTPELWIFDESILTASTRPVELVWRMEVTAKDATQPIREMVLVNAQTGTVSWHINQVDHHDTEDITANSTTGTYVVTASASGITTPAQFTLTNATWFVSPSGSDINSCFAQTAPCKTIQAAINKAFNGDTILVAEGTYNTGSPASPSYVISLTNSNYYHFSGGWDSTFTNRSGRSIIDGNNSLRGIQILSPATGPGSVFEHFIVQNCLGSGIYIQASEATFTDMIIRNNTVDAYGGAAVYVSFGTVVINDSLLANNKNTSLADAYSGGAISQRGSLTLNNTTVINNASTNSGGGGIYTQSGYTLTLNNSTISGNSAAGNGGGLLLESGATVNINNSTIAYNSAQNGGGVYIKSGSGIFNVRNSIISNNSATVSTADCYALAGNPLDLLNYSLIGNTTNCTAVSEVGDLKNVAPLLNPTIIGWPGFHLIPANSPVIAKGDPTNPSSCLPQDERGVPRDVPCDMGAVEYVSTGSPAILTVMSGSGQEAVPLTAFTAPLSTLVTDQYYNPVPGIDVTFTAPLTGASGAFADTSSNETHVITGSDGIAVSPIFTANATSGSYTVSATTTGVTSPASFLLKNVFPSILISNGSPQSTQVLKAFSDPLKVLVQYAPGAPVPGVTVTFTAPVSGASGTFADTNTNTTTAVTDASGIATSSVFTANNVAGSYVVKATIPDIATSADFQLTNIAAVTCTLTTASGPNGLFLPYRQYNCGKVGYGVGRGDFNHDGKYDVALSTTGGMLVFLQSENGTLLQPRVYAKSYSAYYLAVGDLNNDGLDDIVTADSSDNQISVFTQKSDGTLANRVTYSTNTNPDSVAVGDINSDGRRDVVVSHWNSAVIGVFIQNSNGALNPMVSYPSVTAGYDDIAIGDVNSDGRNDVVKMNGQLYANPNLQAYLQNASDTLNTAISYSLGCNCLGSGIGIGDVTGDGRSDVVMSYGGNQPDSKIAVFAQDANGGLQAAISYPSYDSPNSVEIADVNSDGRSDVITLHGGWYKAGAYLQQDNGTLQAESLYSIPYKTRYYPQDLNIGDVNNDALPDVLVADNQGLVILYRNTTIPPTSTPVPTFTPSFTPGPTFTPSPTFTPGPGPSRTPGPTSTPGASPTPVAASSTGSRRTYSASGVYTYPGTFLCDETQSICTNGADPDADKAHQYAADTFVFYNTHHQRNSFDNQGSTITSTVHYGVNYRNAFWTGYQMVYGDGMAADDVVGHEITHGVTQYTSNLIYSYQSGAINESFSDVWGEFIDQTNSSGNDMPSVKWMLGEDTPLGIIRSMSNPPTYGHPDKMSSPYYYKGSGDNGGVHINSGVNNKAAYLMVDGATFNGRTIIGIGLNKTAAVYYEAQANLLTAGSNYNDLYYALIQACQNLIGGADGITQNDCDQVTLAAEAVEMIPPPPPTPTPTFTPTFTPINTATFTPTATATPSQTPTNTFTPTATPPYSYHPLYLSLTSSQTIGGVSAADEDILRFDGQNWSLFFDGSDVGVGSPDLFAFSLLDADSILMSFSANVTVNGITATPQDVLRFDATSLGSTTAGTFSMYFDGSDVGFDTTAEKIDSLTLLADGRLLISTTGNPSVPGLTTGKDEDVLAFTSSSLGDVTNGTWAMYFDGSDVGLADTSDEDVDALDVTSNGNIYLSTLGNFAVTGLSGFDEDVFVCVATSIGDVTACNYSSNLYFDGSTWGLDANDVDAFNFLSLMPAPTSTPTSTPTNTPTPTRTPTRTPSPTVTKTFTPTMTLAATNTPSTPLTLTVNNLLDAVDANPGNGICETAAGNGICTLRAAIQETNARSTADTIVLPAGTYTLTLPGNLEEAASSGDLDITSDLTITGTGANTTIIDGNGSVLQDRVFDIKDAYTVNFSDLTIRGGNSQASNGGGISNYGGILTLNRVVLRDNVAGSGGFLLNRGTTVITDSNIYNNTAAYDGGGIRNDKMLTIIRSTISGNFGNNNGGGIYSHGSLTLVNSTISGNQAYSYGGGISVGYSEVGDPNATVDLKNVTITNNLAEANSDGYGDGGGIYLVETATVSLWNTILAGNLSTAGSPDCDGTLTSYGHNLIKSKSGCSVTGDTTGNLIGVNPNLGSLQENGGPTLTHALLSNSPAINAGNDATCESTDQRGVTRPQGAHCDIGAFEYQAPSVPTPTSTATAGGPTPTWTPTAPATFTPSATASAIPTNTPIPTATSTASGSDVIFADGFESGTFSTWTSATTGGGDLSVSPAAALLGSNGMQVLINDTTALYVTDNTPNAEARYRARFYFTPNSITMATGNYTYLLAGRDPSNTAILQIQFNFSSTGYQLRARAYDSVLANWVNTPYITISNAVHSVEVDWGSDGHLSFWIDGVQQGSLTGINNSSYRMDSVRLGATYITATTISGSYYIDGFESRRETYIGP
jgi:Zn-dependent metalloprotease